MKTAAAAVVVAVLSLLGGSVADVKEPATHISFKESMKLPGGSQTSLAGVGVRVKKIGPVKAKVYALGMYMDKSGAQKTLSKYTNVDKSSLKKDQSFFNAIKGGKFEKTFVLKMARKVGTEKMVSALAESVKPRMRGSKAPLEEFESILLEAVSAEGAANKGMQFGFVCKPGSLCVSINGKQAGTISSGSLSDAMQDVYLDGKGVSPDCKANVAQTISGWLA